MFEAQNINTLVQKAYNTAVEKGWHETKREFGTLIALMHSEITEAAEAKTSDEVAEELADVVIRIFDLCGLYKYDLGLAVSVFENKENVNLSEEQGTYDYVFPHTNEFSVRLLRLHSSISKVLEVYRRSQQDDFEIAVELAIVLKRVVHFAKTFNLELEKAVVVKMEKNKKRPYKHGGKKI